MTRRTALIALGIVTLALGAFLLAIDPGNEAEGNPTIVDFEFAWDEQGAAEILDEWGEEGEDAARLSLWVDFAYLLAYGAFLTLASIATREFAAASGMRRLAAVGAVAVPAGAAAAVFDAIEDIWLLIALDRHGGDLAPLAAGIFATGKFICAAGAIAYLVAGLVARFRRRGAPTGAARS
jgi:hypothetical protein